jgi:hypothetical protein
MERAEAVARFGHGRSPLLAGDALASELSTTGLGSVARLPAGVEEFRTLTSDANRKPLGHRGAGQAAIQQGRASTSGT